MMSIFRMQEDATIIEHIFAQLIIRRCETWNAYAS